MTPSVLDAFVAPGGAETAALLLFRMTGVMVVAPMFSAKVIPMSAKGAITVLIVLFLLPGAMAEGGGGELGPVAIISETLVGFALGFAAGILVHAAEAAGDFMAVQTGLSGANLLDPLSDTQLPVLGQFFGLMALTVFLAVGGHGVILEALHASLVLAPLGGAILSEGARGIVELGSQLFLLGVRLAAPVIAAVTIVNASLGVLARTVPQMNVLMTAFPIQIGLGFIVIAAAIPLVGAIAVSWPADLREVSGELLLRLSPTPEGGP